MIKVDLLVLSKPAGRSPIVQVTEFDRQDLMIEEPIQYPVNRPSGVSTSLKETWVHEVLAGSLFEPIQDFNRNAHWEVAHLVKILIQNEASEPSLLPP